MSTSIISIGQAAAILQLMPDKIRAAAVELRIVPAMRINQVDHFDEADLQRIANHVQRQLPPQLTTR